MKEFHNILRFRSLLLYLVSEKSQNNLVKKSCTLVFLLALFTLSGRGTPLYAGGEIVQPAKGKALICFYREVAFEGNGFQYGLTDNGTPIGSLPTESFLYDEVEPGEHSFEVGLLRHDLTKLRVQSGHIYYFRCEPAAEVLYARPRLELVPVTEGAAVVATLRPGRAAR